MLYFLQILNSRIRKLRLFGFVILLFISPNVFSQTSAFTYQGQLADNGSAANGPFQMQFSIYDAVSGGSQIGSTITNNSVTVTGGIFTVQLDFSPATPFTSGADRWLEVAVKKPADATFTPLLPRQRITSSPYSLRTISASTADSLSANCVGCVTDAQVSNTITVGGSGSVADAALSANVAHLNAAETISGNWINTANPWADNEVADNLSINSGTIDNTAIGATTPATGAFTTLTASSLTTTGTTSANVVNSATQYNLGGSPFLRVSNVSSTFVGIAAGPSSTGASNSFFGRSTGAANTSGFNNSFFGSSAGMSNTTGGSNSFFGVLAGSANTTANSNSFFGASAGQFNTTGFRNNFFGQAAGQNNTTGSSNSFFAGGQGNTTGSGNSFFGTGAGAANGTGSGNAFFGFGAGENNTTGGTGIINGNAFFGFESGFSNTTAGYNAFFGHSAGYSNTTGDFNTAAGMLAGYDNITGNYNTFLGYDSGVSMGNPDLIYATVIGAEARARESNMMVFGRTNGYDRVYIYGRLRAQVGGVGATHVCLDNSVDYHDYFAVCTSSLRYKTNIAPFREGMAFVNKLRPITFDWKTNGSRDVGFGAEDVAAINPLFVTYDEDGKIRGVKYDVLSVAFVNAFKEQQVQIDAQQKQINDLRRIVCSLKPRARVCRKEK